MPTPQAYDRLYAEYNELLRAAFRFCMATDPQAISEAREDLWDLCGNYEPTESEQGLIPIPDGYAEQ
jgi:hypothetical protein